MKNKEDWLEALLLIEEIRQSIAQEAQKRNEYY